MYFAEREKCKGKGFHRHNFSEAVTLWATHGLVPDAISRLASYERRSSFLMALGKHTQACKLLQHAWVQAQTIGDSAEIRKLTTVIISRLAYALFKSNQPEAAIENLRCCIRLQHSCGWALDSVHCSSLLSVCLTTLRKREAADQALSEALNLSRPSLFEGAEHMALVAKYTDATRSIQFYQDAGNTYKALCLHQQYAQILRRAGKLYMEQELYSEAVDVLNISFKRFKYLNDSTQCMKVSVELVVAYLHQNRCSNPTIARLPVASQIIEVVRSCHQIGCYPDLASAIIAESKKFLHSGLLEEGTEILEVAVLVFEELKMLREFKQSLSELFLLCKYSGNKLRANQLITKCTSFLKQIDGTEFLEAPVDSLVEYASIYVLISLAKQTSGKKYKKEAIQEIAELSSSPINQQDLVPLLTEIFKIKLLNERQWKNASALLSRYKEVCRRFNAKPQKSELAELVGDCFRRNGLYEPALANYQRALRLLKDNPELIMKLGDLYLELGQPKCAIKAYVQIEDCEVVPRSNRPSVVYGTKRIPIGCERFNSVDLRKMSRIASYKIGLTFLDMGKYNKAVRHFKYCLRTSNSSELNRAEVLLSLGLALDLLGDYDQSRMILCQRSIVLRESVK